MGIRECGVLMGRNSMTRQIDVFTALKILIVVKNRQSAFLVHPVSLLLVGEGRGNVLRTTVVELEKVLMRKQKVALNALLILLSGIYTEIRVKSVHMDNLLTVKRGKRDAAVVLTVTRWTTIHKHVKYAQ
jgi:hypothetical protein